MSKPQIVSPKSMILLALLLIYSVASYATLVVNENIQNWAAHTSYGSYSQEIAAGTVTLTRCLVSPGAAANGEGSAGRIQMEAGTGIIEFPELPSAGEVEFTFSAGSSGRSLKLQKYSNGTWTDLITFSGIIATGSRFYFAVGQAEPCKLRLANPSHAIYVHDIFITDYSASELPIIELPTVLAITYSTVQLSANIASAGGLAISSRGFCFSLVPNPEMADSLIVIGSGISPMFGTITNLSPDTDYYIRAFATNANGTAYSQQITVLTEIIGAPSVQSCNFVFYPGNTSVQASWTPGNGSRRLIMVNTSNSFSDPSDGVEYAVNTVYSGAGEQVVYCGSTQIIEGEAINASTITGLQRNTSYWFRAYEMNGSGSSAVYLHTTALANPSSCTTLNTGLAGYYDEIEGYGTELKADLHNLLRNSHLTQFSYDAIWQQLQYTDEDSINTNNVIETYTGWSVPKSFYGGGTTQWNREHTWSVSHGNFGTSRPAGTDLHHIRPCDVTVNSAKGNKDFDNGGNPYVDSSPYPGYDATTGSNTSTNAWEPRPVEKGDVARMLFYMALRYEGTDTGYNLEMQDSIPTAGAFYGKLSTLLQWHYADPPDGWERRRNDRIQERQGNRNPFIDHPEYVSCLWVPKVNWAGSGGNSNLVANWTHALNATGYRVDLSADSLFSSYLIQDQAVDYVNQSTFIVDAQGIVYFRIRALFISGYSPYSAVVRVNMDAPAAQISYFNATLVGPHSGLLEWTSELESDLQGYYIFRSNNSLLPDALLVSPLIPATNTSSVNNYSFTDNEISQTDTGGWIYYWLSALAMNGESTYFGPDSIYVEPSDLQDDSNAPAVQLVSIYPNPFSSELQIEVQLKAALPMEISIYNLKGQRVKKWTISGAGKQKLPWNGQDDKGRQVAAGVYILKLNAGTDSAVRKLLRVKS